MSRFMKVLNNISRSQAVYRQNKVSAKDLQSGHYAFVLAICSKPGRSQESLAMELCLNKSTVARHLSCLEQNGYITRKQDNNDRRQFSVYPTDKMLAVYPDIKNASKEWMLLLSEGIPQSDLDVFDSVLRRMQIRAAEIIEGQEGTE